MRKVLIVAYYWPPAGGPGVQRWLKFATYLPDFNVEPILYIPENPHYPITDESLLKEVPKGIKIYRKPIAEPYKFAAVLSGSKTKRISSGIIRTKKQSVLEKIFLWIRGNLFIPDARKYWVKPSVDFLTEIIRQEKIDTVITTGPPHSMHLIGLGLKQHLDIPWIVDFRDPWTSIGYHKELRLTKRSREKHKTLEQLVLTSADKIVVTSDTTKNEFAQITKKPISVITNGYDTNYQGDAGIDHDFTISHIGSLLSERNPEILWKVLSGIVKENPNFRERLRLQLVGVVSQDVMKSIQKHGLEDHVNVLGYLSHSEAQKYQQKSQILLLVEVNSEETEGIIPGKLFEYMAAKRPILALGPENWEVKRIISETRTGVVFNYKQAEHLKKTLLSYFEKYENKQLHQDSTDISKYSRRELTKQLAEQI